MWVELLLWLVVVQACGLAALPLARHLFRALPDGGYGFAKVLGLLIVSYGVWAFGMLGYLEYRRTTALFLLALVGGALWLWCGRDTLSWLREKRRLVLLEEAIFLTAGLAATFVRAYNPDIIGQEKFMDLAFFNGFLATSDLPAEDTWMAGYGMAYYPFGYLLLSLPAKLAGLPAAYGYNLAMVLVLALTILLTSALAANLVALATERRAADGGPEAGAWLFGLVSASFVAICGNLVGPLEILAARGFGGPEFWAPVGVKNLQAAANPSGWLPSDGGWWWHGSRVIATIKPDGITEFPYFSFLLGDLHPHYTALPLLLLIMALALAVLLERTPRREPWYLVAAGLALGAPIVANTWDTATAWTLYGLAAALTTWPLVFRPGERPSGELLLWAMAPIPLGVLLFSPYFVGYSSQRLGVGFVTDEHTPLVSLLIINGPFLVLAALLAGRLLGRLPAERASGLRLLGFGVAVVMLGLMAVGAWSAAVCLALLGLVLAAALRQVPLWLAEPESGRPAATVFLLGLAGLGLVILVAVELVFLRDSFGTRMNTVFKFYYHVWLLLGVASGPAAALWLRESGLGRAAPAGRALAGAALAAGLALGLVYPLAATWTKSNGFRGPATLDGAAFLERNKPADAAAIRWLAERPSRPVVLEAVGGDYTEFARVSTFSGLPTVIGWIGHELQWRGQLDEYTRRQQDVEAVYQRAERDDGMRILERYRVRYVFYGSLEREKYGPQAETRLARWLTPVFRREATTVFAVPDAVEGS